MISMYDSKYINWNDYPTDTVPPAYIHGYTYDLVILDDITYTGMDYVTSLPPDPKPPDPKLLKLYNLAKLRSDKVQMSYLEKRLRC